MKLETKQKAKTRPLELLIGKMLIDNPSATIQSFKDKRQ